MVFRFERRGKRYMTRPWLTEGNVDFAAAYQNALLAHFDKLVQETNQTQAADPHRKTINAAISEYEYLRLLMLVKPVPPREIAENEAGYPEDKSKFSEPDHFSPLIEEDVARMFG